MAFIGGVFGKDACSVGIGEEMDTLIMEVAKADPEASFSAEFKISCDLCGDDLWTKYEYRNGKLTTKGIAYQEGVPSYCEDCDAGFDDYCNDLNDPEHFDFSKKYTCPECGAALECDVCGWRSVYALDAHKWKRMEIEQFPKD